MRALVGEGRDGAKRFFFFFAGRENEVILIEWKYLASTSASRLPATILEANKSKQFDCQQAWGEVIHG